MSLSIGIISQQILRHVNDSSEVIIRRRWKLGEKSRKLYKAKKMRRIDLFLTGYPGLDVFRRCTLFLVFKCFVHLLNRAELFPLFPSSRELRRRRANESVRIES